MMAIANHPCAALWRPAVDKLTKKGLKLSFYG